MVKLIERRIEEAGEKYRVISVIEMDKREMRDQLDEFENQLESINAMKDKITNSLEEYRKKSAEDIKKEVIERHEKQVEKIDSDASDIEKEVQRLKQIKQSDDSVVRV